MASARPDLTSLLYLNPELEAYSNVRTIEDAAAQPVYINTLPSSLPPLPPNFDARVYLAAKEDISGINETIRVAMSNAGMKEAAMHRRAAFVNTFMEPLDLIAPNTFQLRSAASNHIAFSTCNLSSGDIVRILLNSPRGDPAAIVGRVYTVPGPEVFVFSNVKVDVLDASVDYTLQGIKIWDAERQARVGYVRTMPIGSGSNDPDQVPRADFREDVYHAVYPDSRPFDYPNTYLDYRQKWRQGLQRIANGDEINGGSGGGGGGGGNGGSAYYDNLVVGGSSAFGAGNLIVTVDDATLRSGIRMGKSNLTVTESNVTVGWAKSNLVVDGTTSNGVGIVSVASSNVIISPDSMSVRSVVKMGSNASIAGGLGIGFDAPDPDMCGTRLAVNGDIFLTGTVTSLSDARAKKNIVRIDNPLERIAKLRGVTFETILEDAVMRRHTGLIAQEVEAVLPEAIYEAKRLDEATGQALRSVAYGNMAGLIVEAINALATRVDGLTPPHHPLVQN